MGLLKQMDVLLILIAHVCLSKAAERTNEFGKKLPVVPFMVIDNFGMQMCLKECEAFSLCSSINFHRKLFVCELNSHRTDGNISLINDQDYVYHEISHPVRKSYYIHKQCDNKSFHSILDIHSLVKDIQSVLYLYEYDDSRLCNVFQLCER